MYLRYSSIVGAIFLLITHIQASNCHGKNAGASKVMHSFPATKAAQTGLFPLPIREAFVKKPSVQISASGVSGSEKDQTKITLTVFTDQAVAGDQSVEVSVSGHEITATDFQLETTRVIIPNGKKSVQLSFMVADDPYFEGKETANITLTQLSSGLELGSATSVAIELIDNEFCPTFDQDPENVQIVNSLCDEKCNAVAGKIMAPAGKPCPEGSSIQYYNGSKWSTSLPVYYQNGIEQAISTRCVCNSDSTYVSSESAPAYTAPGACVMIECYRDKDSDGFGNGKETKSFCESCGPGFVKNKLDCDDNNQQISNYAISLPAHASTFKENARGYLFVSPATFHLKTVMVPRDAGTGAQNIAVVKFKTTVPDYPNYTNNFEVLFQTQNNKAKEDIPVDIEIKAGDIIGILGQRDNSISYGTENAVITIGEHKVPLQRIGMQFPLNTHKPQNIWVDAISSNTARIFFNYCLSPSTK